MKKKNLICKLCGANTFVDVLNLGKLPLGFPVSKRELDTVWRKALALVMCKRCKLVQTVHKIPHSLLIHENLSTPSVQAIIRDHDKRFAADIVKKLLHAKSANILEIGPADGNLLMEFQRLGFKNVLGLEPSPQKNMKYPFEIIPDFLNKKVIRTLKTKKNLPDCIVMNYTLELIPNLKMCMSDLEALMKTGSHIVIEVPYFIDFMDTMRIDGFAHLRTNWFSVGSLRYAFEMANIEVIAVTQDRSYRGGTLQIVGRKVDKSFSKKANTKTMERKEREKMNKVYFTKFQKRVMDLQQAHKKMLAKFKKNNYAIYGYGAGLKSSTLINWLQISGKDVAFVVDKDRNKIYKFVPHAEIIVEPVSKLLQNKKKSVVLLLAIDHKQEIQSLLQNNLVKGSYVVELLPSFKTHLIS